MNAALRTVLIIAALASLIALAWTFSRASAARREAESAHALLTTVESHMADLDRLDAEAPAWTSQPRSAFGQGGMAAAVNDALAKAGIPASALASFSPPGEQPAAPRSTTASSGSGGIASVAQVAPIRRRAVLTLAPVTLPQLGTLLAAWCQTHPDWVITSIDLAPEPIAAAPSRLREAASPLAPGTDLPLRAVIALESLSAPQQAMPRSGQPRSAPSLTQTSNAQSGARR